MNRRRAATWLIGTALAAHASACTGPPPSHALIVRHPEQKCGLIAFSDCRAYAAANATSGEDDADGGEVQVATQTAAR